MTSMTREFWILLFFFLLVQGALQGQNSVTGTLNYDNESNEISASFNYKFQLTSEEPIDSINFTLNGKAQVVSLSGENVKQFDFSRLRGIFNSSIYYLTVYFDAPVNPGEIVNLDIKYTISDYISNIYKDQWFEIHSEYSAIPISRPYLFDWNIDLTFAEDFTIISAGSLEKESPGRYNLKLADATDITLFGGRTLFERKPGEGSKYDLKIYSFYDEVGVLDSIYTYCTKVLDFYHDAFAKNIPRSNFTLLVAPSVHNFAFRRNDLIMIRDFGHGDRFLENLADNMETVFHEIGHLWWIGADNATFENWLNESFAEYVSDMATGAIFGEELFRKEMKRKEGRLPNYGPVYDFENGKSSIFTLYNKGAFILHQLDHRLGRESFNELLSELLLRDIKTTEGFLELLGENFGEEHKSWLDDALSK